MPIPRSVFRLVPQSWISLFPHTELAIEYELAGRCLAALAPHSQALVLAVMTFTSYLFVHLPRQLTDNWIPQLSPLIIIASIIPFCSSPTPKNPPFRLSSLSTAPRNSICSDLVDEEPLCAVSCWTERSRWHGKPVLWHLRRRRAPHRATFCLSCSNVGFGVFFQFQYLSSLTHMMSFAVQGAQDLLRQAQSLTGTVSHFIPGNSPQWGCLPILIGDGSW